MSSSKLIRWGGLAGIVSGLLSFGEGMTLLYGPPPGTGTTLDLLYEVAFGGGAAAWLVALLAIRQIHLQFGTGLGRVGRIGWFVEMLGVTLLSVKTLLVIVVFLSGGQVPFIVWPLFMAPASVASVVGPVLLGIGIVRAGVLPRWMGWLQTLSVPLYLVTNGPPIGEYGAWTSGLIAIVLGYGLLTWRTQRIADQAPHAT